MTPSFRFSSWTTLFAFLSFSFLYGQQYNPSFELPIGHCTINNVNTYIGTSVTCSNSDESHATINQVPTYGDQDYWIPDSQTPEKTIHFNFVVFHNINNSPAVNWQNTIDHKNRLSNIANLVNTFYNGPSNFQLSSDNSGTIHIPERAISFELDHILFVESPNLPSQNRTSMENDAWAKYPEQMEDRINVFVYPFDIFPGTSAWGSAWNLRVSTSDNPENASYSCVPNSNSDLCPISLAVYNGNSYRDYSFADHLKHEFGHCLRLEHVLFEQGFSRESLDPNDPWFLSDVFQAPWCTTSSGICFNVYGPAVPHGGMPNYAPGNPPADSTNDGITNNIMGSRGYGFHASAMQLGRMHQCLSMGVARVSATGFSSSPVVLTNNETWDFKLKLYSDLVIPNGVTLTLKCELNMPEQGSIIIEPGGELIIDGGEVTGTLNKLWRGIQVLGNSNQNQVQGLQGRLRTKNGAVLRDMEYGVVNHGYGSTDNVLWATTGGLILAKDATFINNKRDIGFQVYKNIHNGNEIQNLSLIENCHFEVDEEFILEKGEKPHFVAVHMNNGIRIRGNTFIDTRFEGKSYDISAINVVDGTIHVESKCASQVTPCTEYDNNRFENLRRGIFILGDGPGANFYSKIKNAEFYNNYAGAYIGGTNFTEVVQNDVKIVGQPIEDELLTIAPYGLYFEGSSFYWVEENTFSKIQTGGGDIEIPDFNEVSVGIIHNNSALDIEEVYRNSFTGLYVGVEAITE